MKAAVGVAAVLLATSGCSASVADQPSVAKPANVVGAVDVTFGAQLHGQRLTREDARADVLYVGDGAPAAGVAALPVNLMIIGGSGDALAAIDYLRGATTLPIIVHGFSSTGMKAAQAAAGASVEALVLEGAAYDVARDDDLRPLRRYAGSLLLVVGDRDRVTPPEMSQKLLDLASTSPWKRLVVAAGKTHGDAMTSEVSLAAYRELIAHVARR